VEKKGGQNAIHAAQQQVEEERTRIDAEAQAEKTAKADREKQKQLMKKQRTRLKAAVKALRQTGTPVLSYAVFDEDVEFLIKTVSVEAVRALSDHLEAQGEPAKDRAAALLKAVNRARAGDLEAIEADRQVSEAAAALRAEQAAAAPAVAPTAPVWQAHELHLFERNVKKFPAGSGRWDRIAEAIGTKNGPECETKWKDLMSRSQGAMGWTVALKEDIEAAGLKDQVKDEQGTSSGKSEAVTETPVAATPQHEATEAEHAWSAEEDITLVRVVKAVPKTASDRWEQVAAQMQARSKVGCETRYNEIVNAAKTARATVR
jgi:DnaJ family protein C protein 2